MARFSPQVEQWRPLVSKYFAPEDVDAALAIMQAESGGVANRPSEFNKQGTEDSWGLFQVNIRAHGGSPEQWSDPETNVRYAAQLKNARGDWRDWYNSANSLGLPVSAGQEGQAMPEADPLEQKIQERLAGGTSERIEWVEVPPGSGQKYPYALRNGRLEPVEGMPNGPWPAQQGAADWTIQQDPSSGATWAINRKDPTQRVPVFAPPPQKLERPDLPPLNTSAPYYWVDGDNGPELRQNPNYRDPNQISPMDAWQMARARQQDSLAAQQAAERSRQWEAQFGREGQQWEAEQAWRRAQAEIEQRQFAESLAAQQEARRQQLAQQLMDSVMGAQIQGAPMAWGGQPYHAGFEAGGPYERLLHLGGGGRDLNTGKVVPVNIDPNALWQQARQAAGA